MPEPTSEDVARWVASFRENLFIARLSIFFGGVGSLAGMLASVFVPLGHPLIVWLATTYVLCAAFGLGIAKYVLRRDGGRPDDPRQPEWWTSRGYGLGGWHQVYGDDDA